MKNFSLSKDQLNVLRLAHRSEKNRKSAYKLNAIILLGTGWKIRQVKDALLIDDETLRHYVNKYNELGIEGLLSTHHKGSNSYLSEKEKDQLCVELDKTIHLTTKEVADYVRRTYDIQYSISGMRDLLHRIGYEYKKPTLVPGNPDREAQEIFSDQYHDFMLKKPDDVDVFFVDAVHPEHNATAAYGWIKRGIKKELKTNSGRQRLNLHGAMHAETLDVTILESSTVNGDSTIDLITMLNQKYFMSSKILLILDNAKYHYSKEVKAHLLTCPRVKLVFLPSYSPNLNLIERLWKFFKKKVLYNRYHENISVFRDASIQFFRDIEQYSGELESIMGGGFEMNHT
jgi:transposase